MIQYKISSVKSPKTGLKVYFPTIVQSGTLTLGEVAGRIAKRSTMHTADIKAVLSALEGVAGDALANGHTVRLGDLGSFRLTCAATGGEDDAANVTAKHVSRLRIRFTPSGAMQRMLRDTNQNGSSVNFCRKESTPGSGV